MTPRRATRGEWAVKRAKSLMGFHVDEADNRDVAWLVQLEHARAVRIVKAEIKRVTLDQHEFTPTQKMRLLEVRNKLLAKQMLGR